MLLLLLLRVLLSAQVNSWGRSDLLLSLAFVFAGSHSYYLKVRLLG
jgi:hypothetical protein